MDARLLLLLPLALMLAACAANPPFAGDSLQGVDRGFTPQQALKNPDRQVKVMWGGTVVDTANFKDHTDVIILSFPVDKSQRPDLDKGPGTRFTARYPGYVETMLYQPGRLVTVVGTLQGVEEGQIGQARYQFPVVKVERIYLWPVDDTGSRVRFGVGLGIGVHM